MDIKLKDKIQREFIDKLAPIGNKNNGGCLFMCLLFYRWLKKEGLPTESFIIKQYDYDDMEKINHNISWIEGNTDYPSASYHFTWIYEGEEMDSVMFGGSGKTSTGVELDGLNNIFADVVEDFCIEALNNASWNEKFCRGDAINFIEEEFGIYMGDVNLN